MTEMNRTEKYEFNKLKTKIVLHWSLSSSIIQTFIQTFIPSLIKSIPSFCQTWHR